MKWQFFASLSALNLPWIVRHSNSFYKTKSYIYCSYKIIQQILIEDSHIKNLQTSIATNGDQAAFKELYYLLFEELFRFAHLFIQQKQLAEEVVQDVFTKLWQQRHKLAAVNNLRVYLYASAKNTALNYRKKYPLQSLSSSVIELLELSYGAPGPEDLMVSTEILQAINHAIQQMPPKCKLIFLLVKEDGLKYKDVAQILNISQKTVENQMGIALKKLAAALHVKNRVNS